MYINCRTSSSTRVAKLKTIKIHSFPRAGLWITTPHKFLLFNTLCVICSRDALDKSIRVGAVWNLNCFYFHVADDCENLPCKILTVLMYNRLNIRMVSVVVDDQLTRVTESNCVVSGWWTHLQCVPTIRLIYNLLCRDALNKSVRNKCR